MNLFELALPERAEGFGGRSTSIPQRSCLEDDFPAVQLSLIAERESWRKEVQRPATSTHKWWAKRLGSIFRGVLAAAVTESQAAALDAYSNGLNLNELVVLDPFAGSGTTMVEATKLGARAVAFDINPVATLVQRQAVQHWDRASLGLSFEALERDCRPEIDRVHRAESGDVVLYYFWVATAECPACREPTRLFSSQIFSQHAYPRREPTARAVCPECLDVVATTYDFDWASCRQGHRFPRAGAVERGSMRCSNSHVSPIVDALDGRPPRYEMYAKLVLDAEGYKHYEPISAFDRGLYDECHGLLGQAEPSLVLPRGQLEDGENTRQAIRWGFREWRQFFNVRQLYSLGLIGSGIRDLDCGEREREALATLFSGTLEFNNLFCSFKGEGTGAVRHMFSHHVLKPERTPLEAHPWGTPSSSGSFSTLFARRLMRAQDYKEDPFDQVLRDGKVQRVRDVSLPLPRPLANSWSEFEENPTSAYVKTMDSSSTDLPDGSVDLVITDPPYMDNVHYSELADFFHAWLRALSPFESYLSDEVSTRRLGEVQSASPDDFETAIAAVWRECCRVLRDDGLLAFSFHQARIAGWVSLVSSLAEAGFIVTAIQPVKGEMSTSSTKYGREPSNLDSIVVCRKTESVGRELDREDLAGLAADGERKLAVLRDAGISVGAGDIRSVIRGHVLAAYTASPATLDLSWLSEQADELAAAAVARAI